MPRSKKTACVNNPFLKKDTSDEEDANEEEDFEEEEEIMFIGTKKIQQDDNKLLFKNTSVGEKKQTNDPNEKNLHGNCAMITFFQFIRATRIHIDVFYDNWLKKYITQNIPVADQPMYETMMKILKPIWNGIMDGKIKNWRAIGYHDLYGEFRYTLSATFINSLYGIANKFLILIYNSMYSMTDEFDLILDYNKQQAQFDDYISFMSKYTTTIPLIIRKGKQIKGEKFKTNHIFLEIYDVDKKALFNLDSNVKSIKKLPDQQHVYYLICKMEKQEPSSPLKIKLADLLHKKVKSYNKSTTRFPNLKYSYPTILKSGDTKYHLDHSAIHSLLLFMQTLPITLTKFFDLFKDGYAPLKDSNYKQILSYVNTINKEVVKNPIGLLNNTYTYQKGQPGYKRLIFTKEDTKYQKEAEQILDAILVCITGYKRTDMCKYVENNDVKHTDKISKNLRNYIKILIHHTTLIPLIRVHVNKALNGNEIIQRFVPLVYDFQIYDTVDQKTYNADLINATSKHVEKPTSRDLDLYESIGNYIPLRLFYSKELWHHGNFEGVDINASAISKLLKSAKNKQLDKKYLTL